MDKTLKIMLLAGLAGGLLTYTFLLCANFVLNTNPGMAHAMGIYLNDGVSYIQNNACTIDMTSSSTEEDLQKKINYCWASHVEANK